MNGENLGERLRAIAWYDIVFSLHAELRLVQRQVKKESVVWHLRNPVSLKLAEKLPAPKGDEKYKLWFLPSKRIAYIYVIVINHSQQRIIVKTVIKQRLMWQKKVERNVR